MIDPARIPREHLGSPLFDAETVDGGVVGGKQCRVLRSIDEEALEASRVGVVHFARLAQQQWLELGRRKLEEDTADDRVAVRREAGNAERGVRAESPAD